MTNATGANGPVMPESQPPAIPAPSWGVLWRMAKRLVRLKLARWLLQFGFAIGALKRVEKDAP
jgi:hypothetical protein